MAFEGACVGAFVDGAAAADDNDAVNDVVPPSLTKDKDTYVGASVAFEGVCVGAFMDGAAVVLPPDQDLSHTLPPVPYSSVGLSRREGDFVRIGGNGRSKKKEAKIEKEMTRNFLAQCCCSIRGSEYNPSLICTYDIRYRMERKQKLS